MEQNGMKTDENGVKLDLSVLAVDFILCFGFFKTFLFLCVALYFYFP